MVPVCVFLLWKNPDLRVGDRRAARLVDGSH